MDGPEYGRRPYDDWTGGGRERRPLFLCAVALGHAIWFFISAAAIAAGFVTGLLDGRYFEPVFPVPWPLYIISALCLDIGAVLVDYFIILAMVCFWTFLYRKLTGFPVRPKTRPEGAVSWDRMPLGLKLVVIYGVMFVLSVVGSGVYITVTTAADTFGDTTGAGPLIGVIAVPALCVLGGMAACAVMVFAGLLIPGWFLAGRMLVYILDTLGVRWPRRDGGGL